MATTKRGTRRTKQRSGTNKSRAGGGRRVAGTAFFENANDAVKSLLKGTTPLTTFLGKAGKLTKDERLLLVDQALVILELNYVHLPLKRAMHAIDPIQRLRLLRHRIEQTEEAAMPREALFHNEMTDIFTSTRDLHTNYLLPAPFNRADAILPIQVEEYFEGGQRKYLLSRWATGFNHATFKPGVEITYWNGVPIDRAVELNGERQAGSNLEARHACGLDSLTIRPLIISPPPDEETVVVGYRTTDGKEMEVKLEWTVTPPQFDTEDEDDDTHAAAPRRGLDLQTRAIQLAKKVLFAPDAVAAERAVAKEDVKHAATTKGIATSMPGVFRAHPVETPSGTFAYIRIFTFDVNNDEPFVREFIRLVEALPQEGLIIDVRGNGGGLITAGERLLQVLTPRRIEPERLEFINTPLNLRICRLHAPSKTVDDFDLSPWIESISGSVETGATYSLGFPITPVEQCNDIGQRYFGNVVLIIDAICYSTTDIFTAGFQDHEIGPILGVSGNTGAGGANVWEHGFLRSLMKKAPLPNPYEALPHGADMRVAIRRTLRVGKHAGTPVEDLGVLPEKRHFMTQDDLLKDNVDLINEAASLLAAKPVRQLSVEVSPGAGETRNVIATTRNISRLDVFLNERPQQSLDVSGVATQFAVALASSGESVLELQGFNGSELVASRRIVIS